MKKKIFFGLFLFFVLFLCKTSTSSASCFYIGNTGYGTCIGGASAQRCQGTTGSYYACCNQPGDVCPAEITTPVGTATPIPPNPVANTTCGEISQRCCSGNTCDNSGLTCNPTAAGSFCMTPLQIQQQQGLQPKSNSATGANDELTCDGGNGIQTAIGCINVLGDQNQFLGDILRWAVGVGGGIAFLLIVYAGFMVMTAAGNPERLKAGQELLTSAISGLILLIFSIFILKFIGIDILGLDKFGFGK